MGSHDADGHNSNVNNSDDSDTDSDDIDNHDDCDYDSYNNGTYSHNLTIITLTNVALTIMAPYSQAAESHRPDDDFNRLNVEFERGEKTRTICYRPRCPFSAKKRGTFSCRNRRPLPDVGPLASKDYLRSYFSLQSTFKISKFSGLTRNSFLTLNKLLLTDFSFPFSPAVGDC